VFVSVNKLSVSVDAPSSADHLPLHETLQIVLCKGQRNTQFSVVESRFKVLRSVVVGGIVMFIDHRLLTCQCLSCVAAGLRQTNRNMLQRRSTDVCKEKLGNIFGPFALLLSLCVVSLYLQQI
jgi:hypothetical protein